MYILLKRLKMFSIFVNLQKKLSFQATLVILYKNMNDNLDNVIDKNDKYKIKLNLVFFKGSDFWNYYY